MLPSPMSEPMLFCIYAASVGVLKMELKKKRLTLDLDPELQRRLKAVAALKGVSMRQYCQKAIEKELAEDEGNGSAWPPFSIEKLLARRDEIFQGKVLPGNSVDFIREDRESHL